MPLIICTDDLPGRARELQVRRGNVYGELVQTFPYTPEGSAAAKAFVAASDWTSQDEAAALLADCAASPPRKVIRQYRFNETGEQFDRRDMRVRILCRLYRKAEPTIDTPEWREWLDMPVDKVIAEAVATEQREAA